MFFYKLVLEVLGSLIKILIFFMIVVLKFLKFLCLYYEILMKFYDEWLVSDDKNFFVDVFLVIGMIFFDEDC